jgi:hypothetical protein
MPVQCRIIVVTGPVDVTAEQIDGRQVARVVDARGASGE